MSTRRSTGARPGTGVPAADPLYGAVDALLARTDGTQLLPPPSERIRLREAAGLSCEEVAQALRVRPQTVQRLEAGDEAATSRLDVRKFDAYQRLLNGLAERFPAAEPGPGRAEEDTSGPHAPAQDIPAAHAPPADPDGRWDDPDMESVPQLPCGRCGRPTRTRVGGLPGHLGNLCAPATPVPSPAPDPQAHAQPAPAPGPEVALRHPRPSTQPTPSRRPVPRTSRPTSQHPNGPLAVIDGNLTAHLASGDTLATNAEQLPDLIDWALYDARLGAPALNRFGQEADAVLMLTPAAAERLGLPAELSDKRRRRLEDEHPAYRQLHAAQWKLSDRGIGPWSRVYRDPVNGRRQCVRVGVISWGALEEHIWGKAHELPPEELARILGIYAARVTPLGGTTAVTGSELMTRLRPPTMPGRLPVAGSLHKAVEPAPPEAHDLHPLALGRRPEDTLNEEAFDWFRPIDELTPDELAMPWAVAIDINAAFLAAAGNLILGLDAPTEVQSPVFDPKIPGCWLVDLSHIHLDPRLPSPFTPNGIEPTGPAWYETRTVDFATELGHTVQPLRGWLRNETGRYLEPWAKHLRNALLDTMADLGVRTGMQPVAFLDAMTRFRNVDPGLTLVKNAIRGTYSGAIGKFREGPQGIITPGTRWKALDQPTWRPDMRAAVIAACRTLLIRKIINVAIATARYPIAIRTDCVVYASPTPDIRWLFELPDGTPIKGGFRLGPNPGYAKLEGIQPMTAVLEWMGEGTNPARYMKHGVQPADPRE